MKAQDGKIIITRTITISSEQMQAVEELIQRALFDEDSFFDRYYFPHKEYGDLSLEPLAQVKGE